MKRPLIKNLNKKLEKIENARRKDCLKRAKAAPKGSQTEAQYLKRAERPLQGALPLRYLKRRNVFVNYKESCAFDPVSGDGHSYRWYSLTRVIKGQLVLNTYSYSKQTSKHVDKVLSLFRLLKAKHVTVQAPRGLQDLEAAALYGAELMGRAIVELKYARKKHKYRMQFAQKNLATLKKLGIKVTKAMIATAVTEAEADRAARLERQRARVRFVEGSDIDRDKIGLHIVRDRMPSRYGRRDIEAEAKSKGFTKVWVHVIPLTNDDMRDNEANTFHRLRVINGGAA